MARLFSAGFVVRRAPGLSWPTARRLRVFRRRMVANIGVLVGIGLARA
jgi:hypothetical protein